MPTKYWKEKVVNYGKLLNEHMDIDNDTKHGRQRN